MLSTQTKRINTGISGEAEKAFPQPNTRFSQFASISKWLSLVVERGFDLTLVSVCILPVAVIMGLIYILYQIYNQGHGTFFYTGARMGKNKKSFRMIKIRTLSEGADRQFAKDVLTPGSGLELKFGKFLRATRLDELPQLFNILKGDMRFIGPRPLRPGIYETICKTIPNFDLRFTVKPGLIGYSQLLTPHTAPKRVRAFIDNRFLSKRHHLLYDICFIAWALAALTGNLARETGFTATEYYRILTRRGAFRDRRKLRRINGEGIRFFFYDPAFNSPLPFKATVISLNNDAVAIASDAELSQQQKIYGVLEVMTPKGKTKRVQCKAFLYVKKPNNESKALPWFYVLFYVPVSEVNQFILEQYILKQSISHYLTKNYRGSKTPRDQRRMRRIPGYGIEVTIRDSITGQTLPTDSRIIDINSQSMRLISNIDLALGNEIDLILSITPGKKRKVKTVKCDAWVYRIVPAKREFAEKQMYVLNYRPVSEINQFLLDKYVLKQSITDYQMVCSLLKR